jgi:hypothetical protein
MIMGVGGLALTPLPLLLSALVSQGDVWVGPRP